jgi:hypothetical protein
VNRRLVRKTCGSSRWLGAAGTILSCGGMIAAAVAGALGVTASGAARFGSSMAGMSGMGQSPSNPGWVNAINAISEPLLIASLLLVILGMLPRGRAATALAVTGSVLFYVFMFPFYSLPLAILDGAVLGAAYVLGFWRRVGGLVHLSRS